MDAISFDKTILIPALAWFGQHAPGIPVSRNAHVLLLAIAGQEGDWRYRIQNGNGPAHSFWQMERGGGVTGVLQHPLTHKTALVLCAAVPISSDPVHVWGLFATQAGDNLAASFARLLLWTDPHPVPSPTDEDATWNYYVRNWRPGRPHENGWHARITEANAAVPPSQGTPP